MMPYFQRQSRLDEVTGQTGKSDGLGGVPASQLPLTTPLERRDIPPQLSMTLEHIVGQLDVLTQVWSKAKCNTLLQKVQHNILSCLIKMELLNHWVKMYHSTVGYENWRFEAIFNAGTIIVQTIKVRVRVMANPKPHYFFGFFFWGGRGYLADLVPTSMPQANLKVLRFPTWYQDSWVSRSFAWEAYIK